MRNVLSQMFSSHVYCSHVKLNTLQIKHKYLFVCANDVCGGVCVCVLKMRGWGGGGGGGGGEVELKSAGTQARPSRVVIYR